MSLGIDWGVLLAPVIIRVIEALISAILRWIEQLPAEKAIEVVAVLVDKIAVFEGSDDKLAEAKDFAKWGKEFRKQWV